MKRFAPGMVFELVKGLIDQFFTLELVEAIETFQARNLPGQSDGIVGPITLSRIAELHS